MFNRILIANRGEIARRIIRSARRLGVESVAVYSEADARALHVAEADAAYAIGPAPAAESYLDPERILDAARRSGAQAIHPGYGFLSENAEFAEVCAAAGIVFIGPSPAAIRAMGSKSQAKEIMAARGVPVIPGYQGDDQDLASFRAAAAEMGYPVLVKAVAGGGGRGLRLVEAPDGLEVAIASARREAQGAFGDDRLLMEKYLRHARHIEVQVFADRHGNAVHLFERDCSIQRRHQKIIEEAPAPNVNAALRERLGRMAVQAARAVAYEGAGTVEFLLADDGRFYFMEMNTRLQVEHPVTEMITGLDLVEWQLRIAAGEPLPATQGAITCHGHAIEVRLYAEDPARDFLPGNGTLAFLKLPEQPPHVRVDAGVRAGDAVGVFYDPMIAKLIVWDSDRAHAVERMARALATSLVVGVPTNLELLAAIVSHRDFKAAALDTHFIDRHGHELLATRRPSPADALALAGLYLLRRRTRDLAQTQERSDEPFSPWSRVDGWRLNQDNEVVYEFREGAEVVPVTVRKRGEGCRIQLADRPQPIEAAGTLHGDHDLDAVLDGVRRLATVVAHGSELYLLCDGAAARLRLDHRDVEQVVEDEVGSLTAPLPGKVAAVSVAPGDSVRRGQTLMIVEAMKMEHAILAPEDGVVARVHFAAGDRVSEGAVLVSFEQPGAEAGAATGPAGDNGNED